MKRAIIIGASSGIGRALAVELARQGYTLGLTGRRLPLLHELQRSLPTPSIPCEMDISQPDEAMARLRTLIDDLGGMDLLVISAGRGSHNPDLTWPPERDTIAVNVTGSVALANVGFHYFLAQGGGHLVGISSIAGLRGSRWAPAYSASKAFVSNYLEGLRARAHHLGVPIAVTDIRPGFVATEMTAGQQGMFWVATAERAAVQIYAAIRRRRRHAYITRRWALLAAVLRVLPEWLLERI